MFNKHGGRNVSRKSNSDQARRTCGALALLVSLAVVLVAILCAPSMAAAVTGVERLSVDAEGLRVPGSSFGPYMSADGEIAVFTSYADLTGIGATTRSVYVRNTLTGQITRIAEGTIVGLSSDGRYLAAADSNELGFHVYDLETGSAVAVPVPSGFGNQALAYGASLSANGQYLVFGAATPNPGEPLAGHEHIIVYDLMTGTEEQIPDPDTNREWPTISNNGRFVAFQPALTFHPVEVLDRSTGQIVFDPTGYFAQNYQLPRISPDGTRVLFSAIPVESEPHVDHVYAGTIENGVVADLTPSETEPEGALANGNWDPTSRYVSFSAAGAVLPFATNGKSDVYVYVYDTLSGNLTLASMTSAGVQGDNNSGAPHENYGYAASALSENATSVVFQSSAANLVPDDGTGIGETETPPGGGAPISRTDIYRSFLSGEVVTGPPTVTTDAASAVTTTSATLHGTVNPNGETLSDCQFEYGTTESYGASLPCTSLPGSGESPVPVSTPITALSGGTTYYFRVVATNAAGTSYGSGQTFKTLPNPPNVDRINPDAALDSGGISVTITGNELSEVSTVKFGSAEATGITLDSPTSITATAPAGTGIVHVTVTNPGGTSSTSPADEFTYVAPGPGPTIMKLSSKKGPAAGGTSITITGTSFVGVTMVKFGSIPATSYEVHSATAITAVSPPGTTGTVEVHVATPNGESGITSKANFTFEGPTVTQVSPSSGSTSGGTGVTVTGSGFALGTATVFKFKSTLGTSVNCASTSECTVVAPPATKAGTVDVRATSDGKTSKRNPPGDEFTYN